MLSMLDVSLCSFRKANQKDGDLVYSWRVQPEITRQMNSSISEGGLEAHLKWFNNELNNKARRMFIIQYDNIDIGFFTFYNLDFTLGSGTFSWYIGDSSYRGKGIGSIILRLFLTYFKHELGLNTLNCEVKKSNNYALSLYLKNGFILNSNCDESNYFLTWKT